MRYRPGLELALKGVTVEIEVSLRRRVCCVLCAPASPPCLTTTYLFARFLCVHSSSKL